MPRNASGTYSLPVASYVAGTTIKSADMNSNLSDIATALTQSIATTGVTTITAPIIFAAGTLAAPSIAFFGATGTGFYLSAANQIALVNAGSLTATFSASGAVTWAKAQTMQSTLSVTLGVTFSSTLSVGSTLTALGNFALTGTMSFAGGAPLFASSTVFVASGSSHAIGTVPDPGASAGTTRYLREDATWVATPQVAAQCQLLYTSSSVVTLTPYNGNSLFINGAGQTIPSAGVTLGNGGLIASTFYYVYAYMSSGTMTLEAVTTAPAVQSSTGIRTKTGDNTRTLVGAVFTDGSGNFQDTDGLRYTISWFNRRRKSSSTSFSTNRTTTGTTLAEVNSEIRNNFISWNEEEVFYAIQGVQLNSNDLASTATAFAIDSTSAVTGSASSIGSGVNSGTGAIGISGSVRGLTEAAVHYGTLLGAVSANTGTWYSANSASGVQGKAAVIIIING